MAGDTFVSGRAVRPRSFSRAVLVAVCACLGNLSGRPGVAATPEEVRIGAMLPEARIQGLNGPSRKLSEFRGKALIINVWASWCGPCREEMASLERLAWLDQNAPFTVIGISTDDDPIQAQSLLLGTNATISQFIDSHLAMENMLGASRLPLTVLVDANGRVLDRIYGARSWDTRDSLQLIARTFRINIASVRP